MKLMKLKLLVFALVMLAASSAFASLSYDLSFNTTRLLDQNGYLYFQFNPIGSAQDATATIKNFTYNGTLLSVGSTAGDGSTVTGTLPGSVIIANTNGINDYNHGITFGSLLSFTVVLDGPAVTAPNYGTDGSLFSLAVFQDELGANPLFTPTGTMLTIDLNPDGTARALTATSEMNVTSAPIPAAAWLFGSGLMGLVGLRRRKK
jgi:hypothetical protein